MLFAYSIIGPTGSPAVNCPQKRPLWGRDGVGRHRQMPGRNIYLVGSVPLSSTAEVFGQVSAAFGRRIARIPDGEVGARSDWVAHLEQLFRNNPDFERSDEAFSVHARATKRYRYRLKPGKDAQDVTFGNLGYADHARASYAQFVRLRDAGAIAAATRFQVDLAPA